MYVYPPTAVVPDTAVAAWMGFPCAFFQFRNFSPYWVAIRMDAGTQLLPRSVDYLIMPWHIASFTTPNPTEHLSYVAVSAYPQAANPAGTQPVFAFVADSSPIGEGEGTGTFQSVGLQSAPMVAGGGAMSNIQNRGNAAGTHIIEANQTGDSQDRVVLDNDGNLLVGTGAAAPQQIWTPGQGFLNFAAGAVQLGGQNLVGAVQLPAAALTNATAPNALPQGVSICASTDAANLPASSNGVLLSVVPSANYNAAYQLFFTNTGESIYFRSGAQTAGTSWLAWQGIAVGGSIPQTALSWGANFQQWAGGRLPTVRLDPHNVVHLQGTAQVLNNAAFSTLTLPVAITTLPAAYRPPNTVWIAASAGSVIASVSITSAGVIAVQDYQIITNPRTATNIVSIDTVQFPL